VFVQMSADTAVTDKRPRCVSRKDAIMDLARKASAVAGMKNYRAWLLW
jgi:hypothetical protein